MSESTKTAPQTDGTDSPSELTDEALESVAGGAAYLKFDGIKGEATRSSVEYSWKVEAGE